MAFTDPEPANQGEPTAAEERSWLRSTAFWAVLGGISSLLTGLTTLAAVIVGIDQLHESRELSLQDAAYASWNELNQASLANPELNCPNTDAKLQKLQTTADPKSATGGTFADRYSAYGNLVITTSEQMLQMAPRDPYWRFRIAERISCNPGDPLACSARAAAIKRYSAACATSSPRC